MNYNNSTQSFDLIQLLSFYIQLKNIKQDDIQNKYIHDVIQAIGSEIQKLHDQNDIIMKQNQQILNKLDKM